jgi:hypothetical protein
VNWNIQRKGRAWTGDEAIQRHDLAPAKIELIEGQLLWTEDDRLTLLALLLENVGVDKAIRLGSPTVWREAIHQLSQ